jgi:hypothetical protein
MRPKETSVLWLSASYLRQLDFLHHAEFLERHNRLDEKPCKGGDSRYFGDGRASLEFLALSLLLLLCISRKTVP